MTGRSAVPSQPTPLLLIVEDSNEDFEVLQRFLRQSSRSVSIQHCVTGDQALALLFKTESRDDREKALRPGLIVLDLNLPGTDGREVLRRIKQDDRLKAIPVIVFTTSNNPKDIEICYQYGVNSYVVKPIDFAQLKRDIQIMVDYWFEVTTLPDDQKSPSTWLF
ncbi:MAG: response regulator [Leptolyngbya sp. BL-A-14]